MTFYVNAIVCLSCVKVGDTDCHQAKFHNSFKRLRVCHDCGSESGWRDAVVFWNSESKWFKPWTWGCGKWLERGHGL